MAPKREEPQRRGHETPCVAVAEVKTDMSNLKGDVANIWDAIGGLRKDIKEVKDMLNTRLPLWATFLITILGSAVAGLVVKLTS